MDLLLDVNIVLDVCARRNPHAELSAAAIRHCSNLGGRLWLYTGSVQTLECNLYNELKRIAATVGDQPTNQRLFMHTLALLKSFTTNIHWLAALATEGDVFDVNDPEDEQLIRALDRFAPGSIKLLTRDKPLLEAYADKTITPTNFCQLKADSYRLEFIDLKTQQDAIRPQLERNIHRVLHHGKYIMGPEIKQLEEKLAQYVGVKHCITVSSGTDSLLIAMMALGIGPGDEVITTPFTFIATGEMIALLGAKPVFVDIDPRTHNINPDRIKTSITPRTKAIMPVSLYGQCADMDAINAIADKQGLPVIEDGAQSFGATYNGRKSCGLSTIGSTSFFPSKPLGGYGDGGALFTNDDTLAKDMREIRVHGQDRRYHHPRIGLNGRMDTLQAAIVLTKLERFDWETEHRTLVARRYDELLSATEPRRNTQMESKKQKNVNFGVIACGSVATPFIEPHNTSVYAQYTIQVENRDTVVKHLNEQGIPTAVHYPVPLHLQPAFTGYGYKEGDFPVAEATAKMVMSLPMGPDLDQSGQEMICTMLEQAVRAAV